MDLVKEERRRQLFVLGGHRLHDMLRFNIPFLGDPGSIHPDGRDQTGAEYGNLTCFQLPEVEVKGNENISNLDPVVCRGRHSARGGGPVTGRGGQAPAGPVRRPPHYVEHGRTRPSL